MLKLSYAQGLFALSILLYRHVCLILLPSYSPPPQVTKDSTSNEQVYLSQFPLLRALES